MKIVFGGVLLVSGSGKLGGTVFQGGPFGTIARVRVKPLNRTENNQFQPCEKEAFANVAKRWQSLTNVQRTSWTAFAVAPLSGYNTFLKFNLQYYRINNSFLLTAPTLPVTPSSIVLNTLSTGLGAQFKLNATYTASANANDLHIFESINNPAGQSKLVKSRMRLITTFNAIAGAHDYTWDTTLLGVPYSSGMSQFAGCRLFDTVTGFLSPLQYLQFNT